MRVIRMLGKEQVALAEVAKPIPVKGQALVRLEASALCGSEMPVYRGTDALDTNFGHEAAGVVEEVNDHPWVKPGDRVALFALASCGLCRYCRAGEYILCENPPALRAPGWHGGYALVPGHQCMPIPDDIDFEAASMLADAIGVPYRAAKRIHVTGFDLVGIWGLGPMGLTAAAVCEMAGARVVAVEPSAYRRELGLSLGVEAVWSPEDDVPSAVREHLGGRLLTAAFECCGKDPALNQAIACLGVHSRLAMIGENARAVINPSDAFIRRELTAIGVWYYGAGDFQDMVGLVRAGLPIQKIITHRFPLTQAAEAYRLFAARETGKVIFTR